MDKTIKYKKAIVQLFQEYDQFWGQSGGLENRIIVDAKKQAYLFLTFGWQHAERYTHLLCFHLEVKGGKVWIYENNTEALIADELIEKGIAREDIVLGFVSPQARSYTGFAA
jgi:hypothetical protein